MNNAVDYASKIVRPVLVTLSGSPGSGKSTAAKIVCEILGGERIYVGQIRRDMARNAGMTIEQFNEYALEHPETDVNVDKEVAARARHLYAAGKSVIVEGRTQFHFLPESVKVYICTEVAEAARRILEDLKEQALHDRNETPVDTLEEMMEKVRRREENDAERYLKFYGVDHRDQSKYDCVIDSTRLSKEAVVDHVLRFIYELQQKISDT